MTAKEANLIYGLFAEGNWTEESKNCWLKIMQRFEENEPNKRAISHLNGEYELLPIEQLISESYKINFLKELSATPLGKQINMDLMGQRIAEAQIIFAKYASRHKGLANSKKRIWIELSEKHNDKNSFISVANHELVHTFIPFGPSSDDRYISEMLAVWMHTYLDKHNSRPISNISLHTVETIDIVIQAIGAAKFWNSDLSEKTFSEMFNKTQGIISWADYYEMIHRHSLSPDGRNHKSIVKALRKVTKNKNHL